MYILAFTFKKKQWKNKVSSSSYLWGSKQQGDLSRKQGWKM